MVQGRPYGLHIPRTLEARPVANIEPDAVKRKAPPERDRGALGNGLSRPARTSYTDSLTAGVSYHCKSTRRPSDISQVPIPCRISP